MQNTWCNPYWIYPIRRFVGINKLPSANYCIIDLDTDYIKPEFKSYWKIENEEIESCDEESLIEEIRSLFFDSVKLRMRSDVPVGVLLSGGLDSSSIAAAMKCINGSAAELRLISAVSSDPKYDESGYMDLMANHLETGISKVSFNIEAAKMFNYIEQATWFNDEPIGSLSNIAHFLLMETAKELGVTVILSGQGADELLCGYRKYLGFYLKSLANNGQYFKALKVASGFLRRNTIIRQFNFGEAKRYLPKFLSKDHINIKGKMLKSYESVFLGLSPDQSINERQLTDLYKYSVPALVHYEDRISTAWSREIRLPFLDYRLAELFIKLPVDLKMRDGWTKYIFRKAIEDYLPKEIVWRKDKQGFVNPQGEWLKRELKSEVLNYFNKDSIVFRSRIIDHDNLMLLYDKYCNQPAGKGSIWFRDIFNPLALEIWLDNLGKVLIFNRTRWYYDR